jgi:hypothetical protein
MSAFGDLHFVLEDDAAQLSALLIDLLLRDAHEGLQGTFSEHSGNI